MKTYFCPDIKSYHVMNTYLRRKGSK